MQFTFVAYVYAVAGLIKGSQIRWQRQRTEFLFWSRKHEVKPSLMLLKRRILSLKHTSSQVAMASSEAARWSDIEESNVALEIIWRTNNKYNI